ncbi:MAG: arylsulfatase [Bacteroidales bacterium]
MNRITTVLLVILFLGSCTGNKLEPRPHILLIMADDMGYSDLGCYGGEINTPVLDGLAENGIRFTQFYNTARCCPTRASLMTGLYPHESGIGHMTHQNFGPGYIGYLNDTSLTIAEILSDAGYFTAMTGKWHAGAVRKSWPENRGFQRFFGIHHWVDSYFKVLQDCEVFEDGEIVIPATDNPRLYSENGKEWYTTDVFTTKAIEYIDEALETDKPFFQYVAYNAPHWPLEAHDDVVAKYLDSYNTGYEELRKEKFTRMKEMGIISEDWSLPRQNTPSWDSHSDSAKVDLEFRRAVYAAQVDIMDKNIGRLINHLKDKGVLDNTVIFFLSDNGCSAEPMGEDYGWQWETNTRWNYNDWRNNSGRSASQGRVWSVTSNTPFRKNKRFTHEGGIATPLIVHWPEGIGNPGSLDNEPGHLVDIMATCIELAGTEYPAERNGLKTKPPRGVSLTDNFNGERGREHDVIFWEHEGHGALRKGDWKIVSVDPYDESLWELYNMKEDRTETNDLSDEKPGLRAEMIELWVKMAYETKAWPKGEKSVPNPVDK